MVLTLEKCHMNLGWWPYSLVGGGAGVLQISSDKDDRMAAKIKTPPKKNFLDQNLTPKKS